MNTSLISFTNFREFQSTFYLKSGIITTIEVTHIFHRSKVITKNSVMSANTSVNLKSRHCPPKRVTNGLVVYFGPEVFHNDHSLKLTLIALLMMRFQPVIVTKTKVNQPKEPQLPKIVIAMVIILLQPPETNHSPQQRYSNATIHRNSDHPELKVKSQTQTRPKRNQHCTNCFRYSPLIMAPAHR
jgi:hypothetical protein